ncbi:MAG: glycosyltransferase family 39 protein [Steroidobacteraceae bacterium]|jgi:4-amino-4-deoxy-L-arabinose transferase-like glycosyltransferase|nr:glycosyltransferase family 39 protein [Steroidobacteraceae bacterium]
MRAPAAGEAAQLRRDLLWLALVGAVLFGAGLGLRDPWPADEPRFALIARDMAVTGDWLFPRIGGDLYQDKPPVFMWAIGGLYALTGELRLAFLLPSLLAAIGTLLLVYDLGRRAWSREAGLASALLLAFSVQFVIQARAAQIDMLLAFLSTAALYGIGRHLLAGPDWRAYALGGFAAGLGVITKGTGFLALLLVLPFFALRRLGFAGLWAGRGGARWWLAPAAALAAIACWLVPMLVAAALSGDPDLAAYRDEILLKQTVTRYASAWHHHEPWHYFLVNVIPGLWLPGTALLPWLVPRWRAAWRERDGRPWLFLGWIALVLVFFSASTGKRGVYILPALPAFALAAGPWLAAIAARRSAQALVFALAAAVVLVAAGGAVYLELLRPDKLAQLAERYDVVSVAPLVAIAVAGAVLLALLRPRRGFAAWAGLLALVVVVQGFWINPMMNGARSARDLADAVERTIAPGTELGLVAYREQYLLQLRRPTTNFGHRRSFDPEQEDGDAALWLNAAPDRALLVEDERLAGCFATSAKRFLIHANRRDWYLVMAPADPACAAAGNPAAARRYQPF